MKTALILGLAFISISTWAQVSSEPNNWPAAYVYGAAQTGDLYTIEQALSEGKLSIDSKGPTGSSLLYCASEYGHIDVVRYLLHYGASLTTADAIGALNIAIWNDHNEIAMLLIEAGVPINLNSSTLTNDTPLVTGTHARNKEMVVYLLEHGADPNGKGWLGNTALHLAAAFGDIELIDALIKHGAIIDARDNYGKTPFMEACYRCTKESIAMLLSYNANPAYEDAYGECASIKTYQCSDKETQELCAGCCDSKRKK